MQKEVQIYFSTNVKADRKEENITIRKISYCVIEEKIATVEKESGNNNISKNILFAPTVGKHWKKTIINVSTCTLVDHAESD